LLAELDAPFILQDFNPGGASLSVASLAELNRRFPHFRYVKLEEARLAAKVMAIREATQDRLGVLEGWGGMYTLELAPAGIAGVAPGLALTDLLGRVFAYARAGRAAAALPIFEAVLPQIVYSLQNIELFHHAEKLLLHARGVLEHTTVRSAALRLGRHDLDYIAFLNARILRLLEEQGFAAKGGAATGGPVAAP
jgi:4-hydroxy-tetrahydrodipicolinate synthase